jgi:hypothetical protein
MLISCSVGIRKGRCGNGSLGISTPSRGHGAAQRLGELAELLALLGTLAGLSRPRAPPFRQDSLDLQLVGCWRRPGAAQTSGSFERGALRPVTLRAALLSSVTRVMRRPPVR